MNHIVADSSTLILLAKAGLLRNLISKRIIVIPQQVYYESVIKGKEKSRQDSFEIEALVQNGKITIALTPDKEKANLEELFRLHAGERDALAIAIEKGLVLLTDDFKARAAAGAFGIKTVSALAILLALYEKKELSQQEALAALDSLQEFGWYEISLIKDMRKQIKGDAND